MKPSVTITIPVDGDLYRRLRRIAQNEQQSPEGIAADMLDYQLRQQGHRAKPQDGAISSLLLEEGDSAERELLLGLA